MKLIKTVCRRFWLRLSFAVLLVGLSTQAWAKPPVPLLWKATKGEHTLYLLGSFHLLTPQDYPLSSEVAEAFADAEQLVLELDDSELQSPALGQAMLAAAQLPAGKTLQQQLKPQTWQALQRYAQAHNLPLQFFQNLAPWMVATSISMQSLQQLGLDAQLGLDVHFIQLAKQAGKPISGLENGQQQVELFASMGAAEQDQYLAEALSSESESQIRQLHTAWRAGDVKTLTEGLAADMEHMYPALYQRINVARNDAWLPKLETYLQGVGRDDTLVVVGALHLLGKDGVVEKLKVKGYDVQRICNVCEAAQ